MITLYIGKIGAGKTTLAARLAEKAHRKNITVFTNVPEIDGIQVCLDDFKVPYAIRDGLLIWDEAALDLNGRDWKDKTMRPLLNHARLSRHYNLDMVFFSQAPDMDATLRRLASETWVLRKGLWFTSLSKYGQVLTANELTGDLEFHWLKLPQIPFVNHKWVFRPVWYKYTDSWAAPELVPFPPERINGLPSAD